MEICSDRKFQDLLVWVEKKGDKPHELTLELGAKEIQFKIQIQGIDFLPCWRYNHILQ